MGTNEDTPHPPLHPEMLQMVFKNFVQLMGGHPLVVVMQHSPTCPVDVLANVTNGAQAKELLVAAIDRVNQGPEVFVPEPKED